MRSIGRGVPLIPAMLAGLLIVVGAACAQDTDDDPPVDSEPEGDAIEPGKPITLALEAGGVWLVPTAEDADVYADFFFEPAITYGVHFAYTFDYGLGVQLGLLTASPRFRAWKHGKALGFHTDPLFYDVRLAMQYQPSLVGGYIRPFVSLGPSLAIFDFDFKRVEDVMAPGVNASVGGLFFLDTRFGLEVKGGANYYFVSDGLFATIRSWNLYSGLVFAF